VRGRSPARKRSPSPRKKSPPVSQTKIAISQLSRNINKGHVDEIFSNYGKVRNCRVLIDNNTMFHKGVAYVEFACNEDAKNAIKFMDGGQIDGQAVTVQFTLERQEAKPFTARRRTPPKRSPARRSSPRKRSPEKRKSSPKAARNRSASERRKNSTSDKTEKKKRSVSSSSSSSSDSD